MVEQSLPGPWHKYSEYMYQILGEALHENLVKEVEGVFYTSGWGSLDERVKGALLSVPRHRFVPPQFFDWAYHDKIIPLDEVVIDPLHLPSSTASQPSLVALMTQAVLPETPVGSEWKALDIGSGSGYQAAMLKEVGFGEVYGVEINEDLVRKAQQVVDEIGYGIHLVCGDGKEGLAEHAPFDGIVVAAAVGDQKVVNTLTNQLRTGGKLVLPEGRWQQKLKLYTRLDKGITVQDFGEVTFVELQ